MDNNATGHSPDMIEISDLLKQRNDIFQGIDAKAFVEKYEKVKRCVGQHSFIDGKNIYLKEESLAKELCNKQPPESGYDYKDS